MTAPEEESPFEPAAMAPPAQRERQLDRPPVPVARERMDGPPHPVAAPPSPRPRDPAPQRAVATDLSSQRSAPLEVVSGPAPDNAPARVVRMREPEPDYADPGGNDEPDDPDADDPFAEEEPAPRASVLPPVPDRPMPPVMLGSDKPNPLANNPACSVLGCTMKLTPGQVTLSTQKFGKPLCLIHQKDGAAGANAGANLL